MGSSEVERTQRVTPLAQRVLAEQIKIVILQSPAALAAPAAIAAVSPLVLWNKVAHGPLLVTIFLIYLTLFWGLTFYYGETGIERQHIHRVMSVRLLLDCRACITVK